MTYYQTAYPYQQAPYPAVVAPPKRHSGLGITSLIIAILTGLGDVALFLICGLIAAGGDPNSIDDGIAMMIGLVLIASLGISLVGTALGIAGLVQSSRNRTLAVLGLILNGLIFFGMFGLIALSLAASA